ncbi:SusC/RagA family TonB-linked outer membrane protein [Polaribacter sp. Q13]|uniref:SusC/RagA family TonB-linked outer membrane protein n=1 Tax=Polaribacter sp. Q13 TaxID=2806551 RepID=UPI00193C365F|nr:SusC/RagA family TonB-linked outer membrane protein [Polaribacter sp. Q13]QVY65362.1 SusC/RagA family TonB-linked outer membrane protein [Polaribacter sp. Q13]
MKTKFNGFLTLLLALVVQISFAQTKTISGTVSDKSGVLPGVSIVIKGTKKGTESDFDGKFSIKTNNGDVLIFRYLGYKTTKKTIGSNNILNVTLEEGGEVLDEIVVTATGGQKVKKALGYSAASLGKKDFTISKTSNPMDALQGKVSGVDISAGPGPGSTQNVIIRGSSSFGNNQPLYIIDGIPITNSQNRSGSSLNNQVDFGSGINAINPDDIENMTVLKGAAATALYGSRAANGIIMITTKSGKNTDGKVNISYNNTFAFTRVGYLPEEQKQFGQGWSGDRALDENGNWGAAYDGLDRVWGRVIDNSQRIKPYNFVENRIRDFYDLGESHSNSLALSGGNETTNFYLSLSENSVDGPIPTDNDSYNRYTISMKGSHQGEKLKIQGSINVASEKTNAVESGQGSSVLRSLYEISNDISLLELKDYKNKFNNLDNYFTPYGINPYYILNENGAEQQKYKFYGKFQLDYKLLDNLKLQYAFGGDFETSTSDVHHAIIESSTATSLDPGSYSETRRNSLQMNHDFKTIYNTKLFKGINLDAIVGLNVNERQSDELKGSINSLDLPNYYHLSNSLAPSTSSQTSSKRRLMGLYYNLDFSIYDYLYLTLSGRNDWSSTLPEKNNSYFYSGQTLSFILSDFLEAKNVNTGIMNFAKLRVAYGTTGNDADPYSIADRYVSATSTNPGFPQIDDLDFPLNGVNAYSASNRLPNPDLAPELTNEFEVGVEAQFFNSRLGFEVSYYNRFTEGLIDDRPIDPSSGYTFQTTNLGDVRNKGLEINFNATPVVIKDFSWKVNANFSTNDNMVEKLQDEVFLAGLGGAGIYAVEGKSMGQFKVAKIQTTDTGQTIVDGSGMPIATVDTEYIGKDINEDYRLGLTNTFTWKGFSLAGTLDYRNGGYIYSGTKAYMGGWTGGGIETVLNDRKPFIIENSVTKNSDGSFSENHTPVDNTKLNDFYSQGGLTGEEYAIIDRSYLKLRNVNLRYQFPTSITEKINVKSLSLSLSASNILLWTPAENKYIDPETTSFGNDIGAKFGEFSANAPNQTFTIGLNLNL